MPIDLSNASKSGSLFIKLSASALAIAPVPSLKVSDSFANLFHNSNSTTPHARRRAGSAGPHKSY